MVLICRAQISFDINSSATLYTFPNLPLIKEKSFSLLEKREK